jgi:hypothetical protein
MLYGLMVLVATTSRFASHRRRSQLSVLLVFDVRSFHHTNDHGTFFQLRNIVLLADGSEEQVDDDEFSVLTGRGRDI